MTTGSDQPVSREALELGYEPHGVSYRGLAYFLYFFLLTAVVLHTGLWVLLQYYDSLPTDASQPMSAVPMVNHFTSPHLQPSVEHPNMPWQDLSDLNQRTVQIFQKMGWGMDARTGAAEIPPAIVRELNHGVGPVPSAPVASMFPAAEGKVRAPSASLAAGPSNPLSVTTPPNAGTGGNEP
jgi:hypothetical protein